MLMFAFPEMFTQQMLDGEKQQNTKSTYPIDRVPFHTQKETLTIIKFYFKSYRFSFLT